MIIFAGIPDIYYDTVRSYAIRELSGVDFAGLPLRSLNGRYEIDDQYCDDLLETAVRFAERRSKALATGLGVVILKRGWESGNFERRFFPFALSFTKIVNATLYTKGEGRNISAKLYARSAVDHARHLDNQIRSVTRYYSDQLRRTCALLPLKNFRADNLVSSLKEAHSLIGMGGPASNHIEQAVNGFLQKFPRIKDGRGFVFQDEAGVSFKSPPREQFHGGPDEEAAKNGHGYECFLTARVRLGGRYNEKFHYDCTKGNGPFQASLENCHGEHEQYRGHPHLNIYPNDFIR